MCLHYVPVSSNALSLARTPETPSSGGTNIPQQPQQPHPHGNVRHRRPRHWWKHWQAHPCIFPRCAGQPCAIPPGIPAESSRLWAPSPLPPLPPVPNRGQHPWAPAQPRLSAHTNFPFFRRLFGGQMFRNSKWSFPSLLLGGSGLPPGLTCGALTCRAAAAPGSAAAGPGRGEAREEDPGRGGRSRGRRLRGPAP